MSFLYASFVQSKFDASPNLQSYYSTFDHYFSYYTGTVGFADFLDSLRGTKLSEIETQSVAQTYLTLGKRHAAEIPTILSGIARQYDVGLPAVEGILTQPYWADYAAPVAASLEAAIDQYGLEKMSDQIGVSASHIVEKLQEVEHNLNTAGISAA